MESRNTLYYHAVPPGALGFEQMEGAFQPQFHIPRKSLRSVMSTAHVVESSNINYSGKEDDTDIFAAPRPSIYLVTPITALLLWLLGLATAIGHGVFLYKLENTPVGNQTWTFRYSLAIAFVFKSALVASISLALAQYIWFTLRRNKAGTQIKTIDAMFLSENSLLSLLSPILWRSATVTAFMAACAWLMPLTTLVSPTALTIGASIKNTTDDSCNVPVLSWNNPRGAGRRALVVSDYTDSVIGPSITSKRLSAAVLNSGRQVGWTSPCGQNCTYDVQFLAPSWQCLSEANVDDPRAPWKVPSYMATNGGTYWYWSPGPDAIINSSNVNNLLYSPVYFAGLNASTNQFWAAFATGTLQSSLSSSSLYGMSQRDVLGVQAYSCQVVNASYSVRVSYENGVQKNTVRGVNPLSTINIAAEAWNGNLGSTRSNTNASIPIQDIVGMYLPMIDMLSGFIDRDPRSTLVSNTSIGQIPTLINDIARNVTYTAETPYLPRPGLGPLLEELSQNLTISLMSLPSVFATSYTAVTCNMMHTETVWKVDWTPIIIAYSIGLGMSIICLIFGARALIANHGAYDTAFSSILRTTRDEQINCLIAVGDRGTLPSPSAVMKQRLDFRDRTLEPLHGTGIRERSGFKLRGQHNN